jgi:ABC transporter substrate binding protein
MRRREFITLLGGAATWPLARQGSSASEIPHVGYLCFRSRSTADDALFDRLRALGWIEGKNIHIERRFASGRSGLLNQSAAELVHLKVNLIVACASQSALAAKNATTTIPIVFASAGDPVGQKLVASLAHPSGNITGTSFDADPEVTTKQIQLLVRAVPNVARVAILWNPTRPIIPPITVKGISREIVPYAVDGLAGDEKRQHLISERATGIEIIVDLDAIDDASTERTRRLLLSALAALDQKRKSDSG